MVKGYRDNDLLRGSFNELAKETFGLNFEDWYQNGFWSDSYEPYSVVEDHRVVANVSLNRTDMLYGGSVRRFFQLGTVMTRETYRNRGLCRRLMEWIEADCRDCGEGSYLFANNSVLGFYPKFGFQKAKEYQYSRRFSNRGECQFVKVPMNDHGKWKKLEQAMERNQFRGRLDLVGNRGLIMFYVTKFMQDSVYYHQGTDTYVIGEQQGEKLFLHQVFSGTLSDLEAVAELFGRDVRQVTLGFVPMETDGYDIAELQEEDCTFFIKGPGMEFVEEEKLRIPSLAHA
jgi:GNAT superfamily N-acetyltransferase